MKTIVIISLLLLGGCAKADYDLNPWTTVMRYMVSEKNN
jgi:Tfp pilus assembly protein PilP